MGFVPNALKYSSVWQKAAAIAAGLDASEGGLERLTETLDVDFPLFINDDYAILLGVHLWSATAQSAAVAAQLASLAITLPTTSNLICTVEGVLCGPPNNSTTYRLGWTSRAAVVAATITGATTALRDQREPDPTTAFAPTYSAQVEVWIGATASTPSLLNFDSLIVTASSSLEFKSFQKAGVIIRPGGGLIVQSQTVNQTEQFAVWGRARAALPGELNARS